MATIAVLDSRAGTAAAKNITKTVLTGTDDFLYKPGVTQILVIENNGSATPTINIDGDASTTVRCGGLGNPVDVSGGFDIMFTASGSAGADQLIVLSEISAYLADAANTPAVTGGTADMTAYIIER